MNFSVENFHDFMIFVTFITFLKHRRLKSKVFYARKEVRAEDAEELIKDWKVKKKKSPDTNFYSLQHI